MRATVRSLAPRWLAVTALLLAATACGLESPTPLVTVVSGGSSVHTEASTFCFEGQDAAAAPGAANDCSMHERAATVLRVRPGDQVGVDVDKELTERGWVVVIRRDGQEQASGVQREHYFTFQPPFQDNRPLDMEVRSLADADPQKPTGVWRFVLAPR